MPLKSFIEVAADSHFPIQNLPFGVFQPKQGKPRVGVAIGDLIVDLSVLEELGHFRSPEFHDRHVFSQDSLNAFLALGRPAWRKAREIVQHRLSSATPVFSPTKSLDYELEMAFLIGPGNSLGDPVPIDGAIDHIFGFVLMNDWSARDIQAWEYQPLGPFLAKNFCTSISPWVVTMEALEPFHKPLPPQDPEPLPYLRGKDDFTFDIHLEARLKTAKMFATASPSDGGNAPHIITRTNFQNLYWSVAQQLAHHTITGCNLQPGDLLASGTISGPTEESRGCMLELTWRGANPLKLPDGETRKWLEDGDTLMITGWCQGEGYRVGFGEVTGRVLPTM